MVRFPNQCCFCRLRLWLVLLWVAATSEWKAEAFVPHSTLHRCVGRPASITRTATTTRTASTWILHVGQPTRDPSSRRRRRQGIFRVASSIESQQEEQQQEQQQLVLTTTATSTTTSDPKGSTQTSSSSTTSSTTATAATFGLIKAMVGSGVLALPSGLTAITNNRSMLGPVNLLLVVLGGLSAYTYSLYGRLMAQAPSTTSSLGDLWKFYASKTTKKMTTNSSKKTVDPISVANFVYCAGCCLTFLLVIGDATSSLLRSIPAVAGLTRLTSRSTVILTVVTTLLWPLCNLSSLAALAPVSIVGVLGTLVTTLFFAARCPAVVPSSPYQCADPTELFDSYNRVLSPAPLILLSMACVAFMAHFSAPDFYRAFADSSSPAEPPQQEGGETSAPEEVVVDLETNGSSAVAVVEETNLDVSSLPADVNGSLNGDASGHSNGETPSTAAAVTTTNGDLNTQPSVEEVAQSWNGDPTALAMLPTPNAALRKYNLVTFAAYAVVTLINAATLTFGFLTFGSRCAGIVLNNYAVSDPGAALSRLLVVISVIGGFPFLFTACRSGLMDLVPHKNTDRSTRKFTFGLLTALTALSMVVRDAGFVVSFNGALMGTSIIYIFPALMFLRSTQKREPTLGVVGERMFCRGLIGFGILSAVIGCSTSVMNSYFPHLLK